MTHSSKMHSSNSKKEITVKQYHTHNQGHAVLFVMKNSISILKCEPSSLSASHRTARVTRPLCVCAQRTSEQFPRKKSFSSKWPNSYWLPLSSNWGTNAQGRIYTFNPSVGLLWIINCAFILFSRPVCLHQCLTLTDWLLYNSTSFGSYGLRDNKNLINTFYKDR